MKVVIDALPLKTNHRFRGIGFYTQNLIEALQKIDKKNEYLLSEIPGQIKEADIIHYPFFHPYFLTLPLLQKKKTVVTIHDLTPLVFPKAFPPGIKGKLRFEIQKRTVSKADAVIADSQASKKDIVNFLKFPPEKVEVIYLAPGDKFKPFTDSRLRQAVRQKYHLPDIFVLYVGDVNYNKNVPGLAETCREIDVPLVIAGKQAAAKDFDASHPENRPLVQLTREYGQDPNVFRLGFVPSEDLVILYNLAAVYCQPSFYEGFGLPVLEAMSCGCPVVASNKSSLPEICGGAAVLVDPHQGLLKGLKLVLNNPHQRDRLVKAGHKQAKRFSWEKTAKQTLGVYEKVLQQ